MPPYKWNHISKDNYTYIKERIKYAGNFFDMYRIDHFVGLFRIWTIGSDSSSNDEQEALYGKFDPEKKTLWEIHGKKIIYAMLKASDMLPCAEDLGTVPQCSYKTLKQYGIPGIDFQRFYKNKDYSFVLPYNYRKNSSAVISTHDSSFFPQWWNFEAGTIDKTLFEFLCRNCNIKGKALKTIKDRLFDKRHSKKRRLYWKKDIQSTDILLKILNIKAYKAKKILSMYKESYGEKEKFMTYLYGYNKKFGSASPALQIKCIEKANESTSIFSIQLIHEYLYMNKAVFNKSNKWKYRINMPGMINEINWSLKLPLSLENILYSTRGKEVSRIIKRINEKCKRS
jgi:4-alpha-glucanotransferase